MNIVIYQRLFIPQCSGFVSSAVDTCLWLKERSSNRLLSLSMTAFLFATKLDIFSFVNEDTNKRQYQGLKYSNDLWRKAITLSTTIVWKSGDEI